MMAARPSCHSFSGLVGSLRKYNFAPSILTTQTIVPVTGNVQAMDEVSDGENGEFFDAKESLGHFNEHSVTTWDSIL